MKNEPIKYLVVHCSATSPKLDVDAVMIDRWHRARGSFKIGYHYVIKRDGTLEIGRDESEVGAHIPEFNEGSIGICLAGGADEKGKPQDNFTPKQYATLTKLLSELLTKYRKAEILGHRDFPGANKSCPSFDVKGWWQQTTENKLAG